MRLRVDFAVLATVAALALSACGDRGSNPTANAPGSPGKGNATEAATHQAPDTSSGAGPSGVKGSLPHPGSSGGDAVPGTTGGGTTGAAPPPGTGLAGGMGTGSTSASTTATAVPDGSKNRTTAGSVGNR